ncbi:MAG: hypothetical protein CYG60_16265 [Actinobacteria bacterium]|nr:MAG: hypothetical protein CYG60_16265 [Actinomycetota bacterium]
MKASPQRLRSAPLTALARPEGLIFAAVLVGAVLLNLFRGVRERRDTLRRTIPSGLLILLPLVAGAGQLLFYRLTTGTSTANGVRAKSLLFEPIFYPTEFLGQTTSKLFGLAQNLFVGFDLGGNPIGYLFPGAIRFFVLGVSRLVSLGANRRSFWGEPS